jgi:outer membrane protein OmpA-like peptidoglycan-associated protein
MRSTQPGRPRSMPPPARVGLAAIVAMPLLLGGCATREWVQETMDKRSTPVEQRVSTVEAERREDAARLEQHGQQIQQQTQQVQQQGQRLEQVEVATREESERVAEVDRQVQGLGAAVSEATDTARRADTRAEDVDARLTRLWKGRDSRKLSISMSVQFRFSSSELDDGARTSLLDLVREVRQMPGLLIELEGYADSQGPAAYNVQLSERRVDAVRRYLVQNGIEVSRIHSIGLGAVSDAKTPNAEKRRVHVKVMMLGE